MKKYVGVMMVVCVFVLVGSVWAAPQKVNFQGKLTDAAGNPINANVSMTFRIYDVASGGTALWMETQTVTITNGIYNVLLGTNNPIDTELKETKPLWLGVKVGADAEMSPRVELTPGLYDLIILNAVTIKGGNIGFGTTTPGTHVHIRESVSGQTPTHVGGLFVENNGTDNDCYVFQTATVGGGKSFSITNAGNIGIGTIAPKTKLDIVGGSNSAQNYDVLTLQTIPNRGWKFTTGQYAHPTYGDYSLILQQDALDESGNPYYGYFVIKERLLDIVGGSNSAQSYDVLKLQTVPDRGWKFTTGQYAHPTYGDYPLIIQQDAVDELGNTYHGHFVIEGTLHVTGQDIAEPFDMTDIASLELGDVVAIDPANPLHVTKSTTAYDKTVAGIVSSTTQAGYVAGSRSDGSSDKPIALVGRVLCNVSTENGAIEIGDLLTTSNTPGYAMKATDFPRAHGAIMGKALQAFDGDRGQIMVLVTLQ